MKHTAIFTIAALTLSACSTIGPDKYLHAVGGLGVSIFGKEMGMTDKEACVAAMAVGIAKEIIDPVFSTPDVIATSIFCVKVLKGETE